MRSPANSNSALGDQHNPTSLPPSLPPPSGPKPPAMPDQSQHLSPPPPPPPAPPAPPAPPLSSPPSTVPQDQDPSRDNTTPDDEEADSIHSDGGASRGSFRGRFVRDAISTGLASAASAPRSPSSSPFRLPMPGISPAQLAHAALQYLPVPIIVLNNLKTVVLANEAMGRLLGMTVPPTTATDGDNPHTDPDVADPASFSLETLRGLSLSQVGIDMLQDGRLVWVTWEAFFDSIAADNNNNNNNNNNNTDAAANTSHLHQPDSSSSSTVAPKPRHVSPSPPSPTQTGDNTPTAATASRSHHHHHQQPQPPNDSSSSPSRIVKDATVDVVISRQGIAKSSYDSRVSVREAENQVFAKMIVSVWEIEDDQTFFTLSFTNSQSATPSAGSTHHLRRSVARSSTLEAAERRTITTSTPSSINSSRDSNSSIFRISPGAVSMSSSPFPPLGPPSVTTHSTAAPSILQKLTTMKDALLDNTQIPILAMWKDGSVTFPNKAARRLIHKDALLDHAADGFDMLPQWHVWNEDFTRRLEVHEYPISILVKTETPFTGIRIGMYNQEGEKAVFDVLGEAVLDQQTGEFLAGVVTYRDITKMKEEISLIREQDEERFKLICESMPQLVWTATPTGLHDFFNNRWYDYTGLKPEESLGTGWKNPFHPEDMPTATERWRHSLATGEPYMTEYRCQRHDGEWRWHLGRALPLRNLQTGVIEKWFGTCTDVHEAVHGKIAATRTRQQLLSVLAHSQVTIITVDLDRNVTMLEGALIWDTIHNVDNEGSRWYVGENMYEVVNRLNSDQPAGARPKFLQNVEAVLDGKPTEDVWEHEWNNRSYRTRYIPILGKAVSESLDNDAVTHIEGAIAVIMDVTELRRRETAFEEQAQAKRKALASEAAAKEANRLKSQFLANMSHEIRTPITGVLGMAELLSDMELGVEQRDYVQNIYRSANALLTVINDILDFSKVESGHLDIEELPFSLSVIVRDVCNMLRYAAERKSLKFESEISDDVENNLVLIGDPGRIRQIITNLLTNSIKFTSSGSVKFSVVKESETEDEMNIKFTVQDTGIGIEDEVRKKLFQPFSQGDASTARRFGGTGLGLTICKNLLDLMNGRITLESSLGVGTTATFWVPFHKPQGLQHGKPVTVDIDTVPGRLQSEMSMSCNSSDFELRIGTPPFDAVGGSGGGGGGMAALNSPEKPSSLRLSQQPGLDPAETDLSAAERAKIEVMVVEDNEINQKIATKTIQKLGFSVKATWNGKELLEYLEQAQEGKEIKPDIILMDVQMPIIDGYKATHVLRHHEPYKSYVQNVPIVAMTASAIQGDKEKCKRAGMDDYLAKPVKAKILEKMLVQWSLQKRTVSRTMSKQMSSADMSDCSDPVGHCSNGEIQDADEEEQGSSSNSIRRLSGGGARSSGGGGGGGGDNEPQEPERKRLRLPGGVAARQPSELTERADPLTPRATDHYGANGSGDSESSDSYPFYAPSGQEAMRRERRAETDELAMQTQADKLIDAAGGQLGSSASLREALAPERLTEKNMEKLQQEGESPQQRGMVDFFSHSAGVN